MPPADRPYVPFRVERTVPEVLNAAFVFFREEFRGLFVALLCIAGPPIVVAAALTSAATVPTFQHLFDLEAWAEQGDLDLGWGYALGVVLNLVGWFLAFAGCYAYAMLYEEEGPGPFTPREVWDRLRADFPVHLSTTLWFAVVVAGLALMNVVICLGTIAFFVVGAYLGPVLMLTYPARLDRREEFWAALKRCRALVRGAWWPAFGLLAVTYFVVFVAMVGISVAVIGLTSLAFGVLGGGLLGQAFVVALSLLSLLTYVVYALPAVAFTIHYFNLVEQHEGVALEARVEAMARDAEGGGAGGVAAW